MISNKTINTNEMNPTNRINQTNPTNPTNPTNQTNYNIDSFKYQHLTCNYCQKQYKRYGPYMKHIETCKHNYLSFHKTTYDINESKFRIEDNSDLLNSMKQEITNLRDEVGELRNLVVQLVNQNKNYNMANNNIIHNKSVNNHIEPETHDVKHKSNIKIINNTVHTHNHKTIISKHRYDCGNGDCGNGDCDDYTNTTPDVLDFGSFISQIDFCNQSQLLDIFDSDDIVESFFFLWNEALNKWKYNGNIIPMKCINGRIFIFEKGNWSLMELNKIEKMVSYLQQKIIQQLSMYQNTIKLRITNEPPFRDYYLNQVTKINSDKICKSFTNNKNMFIEKLALVI